MLKVTLFVKQGIWHNYITKRLTNTICYIFRKSNTAIAIFEIILEFGKKMCLHTFIWFLMIYRFICVMCFIPKHSFMFIMFMFVSHFSKDTKEFNWNSKQYSIDFDYLWNTAVYLDLIWFWELKSTMTGIGALKSPEHCLGINMGKNLTYP